MPDTEKRLTTLRKRIRKSNAEAILVTNSTNVSYLTGFTGDDSYLLVTGDNEVLLTDGRFTTQLEEESPELDLAVRSPKQKMHSLLKKTIERAKVGRVAFEARSTSVARRDKWGRELPNVEWIPTEGMVEGLRVIKDREEIAAIREAVDVAVRTMDVIKAALRPEQTEREIAADLEHQIRRFGGVGCSFTPIVAVGERAALPHAPLSSHCAAESGLLLIDWGARSGQYVSDLTRVIMGTRISPKLKRIYEVVFKAQRAAIAAIKPGVRRCDVDAAARDIIEDAGFGKRFGHGLGHGIGMEVHEAPRIAANEEEPLKAGMVITVEPGIYLPGTGGVRIEDDVLVTRGGSEVLSASCPAELDEWLVE